ncbi:MAG TPA: co-chaperone GroES family protein [Gemmatimonadaceae bacterium]|nr:co-chaperone GroES family protein [Gemmatimonadaceae bacterium]
MPGTAAAVATRPSYSYTSLEDAFPNVDPGLTPYGSRVLVQIRRAKTRTSGGIYVAPIARGVEQDLTQIAQVRALGPLAFKNRDQGVQWVEGAWCQPGEFVRVPQYGGDRWGVPISSDEYVTFVVFDDLDLIGKITCDPLAVVAYI